MEHTLKYSDDGVEPYSFSVEHPVDALVLAARELLKAPSVGSRNGATQEFRYPTSIHIKKPWVREMLSTTRKASLPAQIAETMWVLSGRNDVEWLSHYLPRATDFADDGKHWRGGYGPRLRAWDDGRVDQLREVVRLLKADPTTRRAVMSIFDPGQDFEDSKDIPCNNWLHFLARNGRLDLHVTTRSNDLIWGWSGINAFEWSVLLEVVAGLAGLQMGRMHFSISSLHLYGHHASKAAKIANGMVVSPQDNDARFDASAATNAFSFSGSDPIDTFDMLLDDWFAVETMLREKRYRAAREAIERFPEPMMKQWLYVIAYWWTGNEKDLAPLKGTDLLAGLHLSPKRKGDREIDPELLDEFKRGVIELHAGKHAAYGNSWKKRGEKLSILANVARKIDRLESGTDTPDETQVDTAIDLWVYLVKYALWRAERLVGPLPEGTAMHAPDLSDHEAPVRFVIERFEPDAERMTPVEFDSALDELATVKDEDQKTAVVQAMRSAAGNQAFNAWLAAREEDEETARAKASWAAANELRVWTGYDADQS